MAKLLKDLREAKESQSPEMKRFLCLERKIKHMETRHDQREQELQQVKNIKYRSLLCSLTSLIKNI